ncbi:MAG TPA: DUF5666 domain-containing protein [Silvibacterium sp.]|nr:DUF5666 domain-containing protein [Silvibacterium sp.]
MKSPLRASILLLAAAVSLPFALGQDAPPPGSAQGQGQGMGGVFAGHGVRGTVTVISGNDISVKTEKGDVYKIETGPNTRFRKEREQVKISDIHVGDMVGAAGDLDDKAKTLGAMFVVVIDKEQYEKARADFGKTWTAGAIQSIDETKITIKRPDNVVQTIVVDENTSFRKRRDSITLADIKVGDNVNARGAIQNGNFVATVLSVGGPGGPGGFGSGGGSRGANNAQPAPAGTNPAPPNQ